MKKQLYILSFALGMLCNNNLSAQTQGTSIINDQIFFDETNNESKWMFFEKTFITNIHEAKSVVRNNILNALPATLILGSFYGALTIPANNTENFICKVTQANNVCMTTGTILTTLLALQWLESSSASTTKRNVVTNFFVNWEENQFFVPEELFEAFEAIHNMIKVEGNAFIAANANAIVDSTVFSITRHFEKRYSKTLDVSAADALSSTKTVTEIVKNFIECGSKLNK